MLLIAAAEGRGHMPSILNAAQSMGCGLPTWRTPSTSGW